MLWRLKSDTKVIVVGEVESVEGDYIKMGLLPFTPAQGFGPAADPAHRVVVRTPFLGQRSICLSEGVRVTCAGETICNKDDFIEFKDEATITFRADFDRDMPCSMIHCFSGAYSGWSQAAEFLDKTASSFCLHQQFEIDLNEQAMELWSVKHGQQPFRCPIHWSTAWPSAKHVGVHGSVADWSIANVIRLQTYLWGLSHSHAKAGQRGVSS